VRVAGDLFKEGMTRIVLAESPEMFDAGVQLCAEDAPKAVMKAVVR
jgi:hypothetical protein